MFFKRLSAAAAGLSLFCAAFASAQAKPMMLESVVKVLKSDQGGTEQQLIDATNVVPGDTLVFATRYRNQSGAAISDFVIVNPVPADVVLAQAPESGTEVSVDGAKTWGQLADLLVVQDDGQDRPATTEDITHLRWAFSEIPAGQTGEVRFNATVR